MTGKGVIKNYSLAAGWYQRAAEAGDAEAQFKFANLYENGVGLPVYPSEARKWLKLAAQQGHEGARRRLQHLGVSLPSVADVLVRGPGSVAVAGVDKGLTAIKRGDYATALKEFRPLAEQGNAEAQFNLGLMHISGAGVTQDYKKAMKWYRKAAEQGVADAQNGIGTMYENSKGVAQDYKEAVKWYRKAAEQGVSFAQGNLGRMYAMGRGVIKDYVQAHFWFNIAATNGGDEQSKKNRVRAETFMTAADIARAQKLAKEWMAKHQK